MKKPIIEFALTSMTASPLFDVYRLLQKLHVSTLYISISMGLEWEQTSISSVPISITSSKHGLKWSTGIY